MMAQERGIMQVAVDAVVFTVIDGGVHLLLIRRKYDPFKGCYALPGGFVEKNESMEDAVLRELEEETGVKDIFLRQIGTYSKVDRDPRGRVISTAYVALIRPAQQLKATTDAMEAQWFSIDALPQLAFDHDIIISDALHSLRLEVQTTNIAVQILPERFTLTQLQLLYESVLGLRLDKRNFRKRIKELGILQETAEQWREGAHRPALLYRFRQQSYAPLREKVQVLIS